MFDFKPNPDSDPAELHRQLYEAVDALTDGEPDSIANMANASAAIWGFLPDLNWAGFYRIAPGKTGGEELVLGPFMGKPACIRIPIGHGVCGTAAQTGTTQRIGDVHAFPGHIACDAASQSELVVPILRKGKVVAVIDLDSPRKARFTSDDAARLERLAQLLADRV